MNKKKVVILICCIAIMGAIAIGCASPDLSAIQSQLDQVSSELDALKSGDSAAVQTTAPQASPAPTASSDAAASSAPATEQAQQPATQAATKGVGDYGISDFETRASELISRMNSATIQDIGTVKRDVNQLEDDMDWAEDQAEADFRTGALTREDYREVERQLEHLEDELDYAEDSMEFRLGYDD